MPKPAVLQNHTMVTRIAAVTGLAVAFGLLASIGVALTLDEGGTAIVWLPNALLVAVLLRSDPRQGIAFLPAAFAANIIVNLSADYVLVDAVYLSAVNQCEVVLIWVAMRKVGLPRPDMQNFDELLRFSLIAGVFGPVISGLLAASFLSDGGSASFLAIWMKWSFTNGLGMLLLAPVAMGLADVFHNREQNWRLFLSSYSPKRVFEWIAIQGIILGVSIVLFAIMPFAMFYLVAPLLLLSAFRLGAWGTAISTILISIVVSICIAWKLGPFYSLDISLAAKLFSMQLFLLSCFAVGLPVAVVIANRDKIRRELREHRDLGNSMLQNLSEVIYRTNPKGEWIFLNPAWEKMTGRSVKESLGGRIEDLIPPNEIAALHLKLAPILDDTSEQCTFDWSFLNDSGKRIEVEVSVLALKDEQGVLAGTVGNIRDVTERKAMESNLIAARHRAEAAADAKSRFLANMSHEIRTPMNGVLGFTQLLLDSELPPEQQGQAQLILDSGNAMMRLLNNILDISKVEAGQMDVNVEPIDVAHILQSCINLMTPSATQKGLDLRLELDPDMPLKIAGDGHHLRQIIINLLGNAIKFTSQGHVLLRAKAEQFHKDAVIMTIDIQDTGIGIPVDRQLAIFHPFEQAENDTAQQFGGSGLGLTISRQLATLIEGEITLESEPGLGTTFSLRFPAKIFEADSTVQHDATKTGTSSGQEAAITGANGLMKKCRLLLVEDHDVNQILIRAMTEKLGYDTELATDGADAVAKIDQSIADDMPFDIVLMDLQMPVMDGYEATRMIRARGVTAKTLPILAITANAYSDDIEKCHASGMQDHIAKPVMMGNLQSKLEQWEASPT